MNVNLEKLVAVFVSVFMAELGDKTQVATLLFAADPQLSKISVFVASSAALVSTSLLAVLVGSQIARFVSPQLIQGVAGVGFIVIGIWVLAGLRA